MSELIPFSQAAPRFQQIFGVALGPFWCPIARLDLDRFEREVVAPAWYRKRGLTIQRELPCSIAEAVGDVWGFEAATFMFELC